MVTIQRKRIALFFIIVPHFMGLMMQRHHGTITEMTFDIDSRHLSLAPSRGCTLNLADLT
jgi:hypothetical protein